MMSLSLDLRIGAIFIIWAASACGVGLPFFIAPSDKGESPVFRCLKSTAAGVMLGIALMHLLPDANEDLSDEVPDYCLAFALTAFGIILNLTMEQMAVMYLAAQKLNSAKNEQSGSELGRTNSSARTPDHLHTLENGKGPDCDSAKTASTTSSKKESGATENPMVKHAHGDHEGHDGHDRHSEGGAEFVANLMQAESLRELVALYAMELSVSVHSIIIGVDIGLLSDGDSLTSLVALICAIAFHQSVEGMGLGTVLLSVTGHEKASFSKLAVFVTLFTCSTPIGIIIGICTSSSGESSAGVIAKGAANSLAAGSLLYISLTEMVASYFNASDLAHQPRLKLTMILCFSMGITFMAIIAVWA